MKHAVGTDLTIEAGAAGPAPGRGSDGSGWLDADARMPVVGPAYRWHYCHFEIVDLFTPSSIVYDAVML